VLYTAVYQKTIFCIISSKNTSFYIYVTLIAQCYMKGILENSFNN